MNSDHIFNWKLLSGSHKFPGPDGGTCINEAAIIAAGFEYRAVSSANDCPPCFSRPISQYAIGLNDAMPDDLRNRLLLPFVTRLAGTADTHEIECQRTEFILIGLVRDVMPLSFDGWLDDLSPQFAAVKTLSDAKAACKVLEDKLGDLARARDLALARALALALARALARALDLALALDRARALDLALDRDLASALARALAEQRFAVMVRILDGALAIGKRPDPLDTSDVVCRLEAVKKARSDMLLSVSVP